MVRTRTIALGALSAAAVACGEVPVDRDPDGGYLNHSPPLGRIEGTVVYEGPAPAVGARGEPLGRVVLLLFRADNPPPPQGLATSAESVQMLPAAQVFAGVTALPGGLVRASVPFTFPNISRGGVYQLRAFYSRRDEGEGFNPVFSVRNQPQAGDVGGGAVTDPRNPASPFQSLTVGTPSADGRSATIPQEGAVTRGVTVFIGLPFATDRPAFRVTSAPMETPGTLTTRALAAFPGAGTGVVNYASDTGFFATPAVAWETPSNTEATDVNGFLARLPTLALTAGLAPNELTAAATGGVRFGTPAQPFAVGHIFRATHPTLILPNPAASPPVQRVPWVFPVAVLVKLHEPDADERAQLASPSLDGPTAGRIARTLNSPEGAPGTYPTVIFGSVVPDMGLTAFPTLVRPSPAPSLALGAVHVVFPPVAFEIRGPDPERDWAAVVPKLPPMLAQAVAAAGLPPGSRCAARGLPAGRYSLTLVTETGQTWTLPNELGPTALAPTAPYQSASQGAFVRVRETAAAAGNECPPGIPAM